MENKKMGTEIWFCNNEIFPPKKNIKHTEHDSVKKKRYFKIKFLLVPFITFFVISIMFGENKEYEYTETIDYVVVEGDTLWDISRIFLGKGYKYIQIVSENDIGNPDLIYAGDRYKITITHKVRVNN